MEKTMDKKINTIAKVGRILTSILIVLMILATLATAAGIGITAAMPKDALSVEVTGTADITAKGDVLGSICDAIIDSSQGGKGQIMLGDSNIAVGDVENSLPEGVKARVTDKGIALSVESQQLDLSVGSVLRALVMTLLNAICTIVVLFMIRALMRSLEKCETPFCDDVIKNMKRFGYSLIPFAVFSGTLDGAWQSILSEGQIGIDLTVVFGILVVFMLVMIFSYGAALQKESDETL